MALCLTGRSPIFHISLASILSGSVSLEPMAAMILDVVALDRFLFLRTLRFLESV